MMRKLKACLVLGICLGMMLNSNIVLASPQEKAESTEYVIELCAVDAVSSKKNALHEVVTFKTVENVTLGNALTIPAGTELCGTITKVKKASGWGCPGKIKLDFTEIKANNGVGVPIKAQLEKRGKSPNFFVQISLLGGFVKGNEAMIKPGDVFKLQVRQ